MDSKKYIGCKYTLGRIRYVIEMPVQTNSKSDKVQVNNKKSFLNCLVLYKNI